MKRALVVDDSKTAQIRLKKMLRPYSLDVDVAFSAEEALGYLAYETPSVIFLDHHMQGMDGLEALKIIKANPNTAMIPVVMYTAQKGDMYVGQARALGALDILSKEIMKASSLQRVLASLGIEPIEGEEPTEVEYSDESVDTVTSSEKPTKTEPEPVSLSPTSIVSRHAPSDLFQVKEDMARHLEQQIAEVRQQISDNSRTVVYKVSEEIEKSLSREARVGDVPMSVITGDLNQGQRRSSMISSSLLLLIFFGMALVAYEMINTKNELKLLAQNFSQLQQQQQQVEAIQTSNLAAQNGITASKLLNPSSADMFDITSWAINTDWQFEYGSQPLDEERVVNISNLVYRLASMGFRGKIDLAINFGDVCLQQEDTGMLRLADEDMPIENCVMFREINPEFMASDYLSLAYLNFEQSAAPIRDGILEVEVTTNGVSAPRHEYPVLSSNGTAGTWNKIALKNNHIGVSLSYQ